MTFSGEDTKEEVEEDEGGEEELKGEDILYLDETLDEGDQTKKSDRTIENTDI
jgi:hypothetical protein